MVLPAELLEADAVLGFSFSLILSETFLNPSLPLASRPEGLAGMDTGDDAGVSLAARNRVTRPAVADGPATLGNGRGVAPEVPAPIGMLSGLLDVMI